MLNKDVLFLTGATGLVGRFLAQSLLHKSNDNSIVALVRKENAPSRLEGVRGDITFPNLGLDPAVSNRLRKEITSIVHCAADIRFGTPLEQSRRVNCEGTRNLLNFAAGCPRLEKVAHISTVYVAGMRRGRVLEEPITYPCDFINSYAQSKWEAEEIVLDAARQLPIAIYRLSTVVSDSETGDVSQFNYVHRLIRLALVNPLDAVPGNPSASIDLITAEWSAAAFAELFMYHFSPGQVLHLCAGAPRSLAVGELFRRTFDFIEEHGLARWQHGKRPVIVDPAAFDAQRDQCLASASRRQFWKSLSLFLPLLSLDQSFDNAKASVLLDDAVAGLPAMPMVFENVLKTCLLNR